MKSKLLEQKKETSEKGKIKLSKTFVNDISTAETCILAEDRKPSLKQIKSKKKEHEDGKNVHILAAEITSTPNVSIGKQAAKSKTTSDNMNSSDDTKPKKRTKSVHFSLDDASEVAVKKPKSEDSSIGANQNKVSVCNKNDDRGKIKSKKIKKLNKQAEKENNANIIMKTYPVKLDKQKEGELSTNTTESLQCPSNNQNENEILKKKKQKNRRKSKKTEELSKETVNVDKPSEEVEKKKSKKRKRQTESLLDKDQEDSSHKSSKTAKIDETLKGLTIGDNAHSVANLLDEMSVTKKKKLKKTFKKKKLTSVSSNEAENLEKIEESKEKTKWKKRKWNKEKKGDVNENITVMIIVENLPIRIILTYKRVLTEHFQKCGQIKYIGIAEMYPTQDSKPVFTTIVVFDSSDAATKALEEDNSMLEGERIRVKRPLPAEQTTLVVRSHAELSPQALSSVFSAAGRVRSIRLTVKGKKAIGTAFIKFDSPESMERGLKMGEECVIGGKKIYVSRFELRNSKREHVAGVVRTNENEDDSENSND